jgi:phosphopantetheinyl transferase (holo-ACP synthase)
VIGNDIIDLALARKGSNWKRKGFLDKIFTGKEKLMISNAENAEIMVWNLWSRKEAAYKIYNRQTQIRGYFPLQLECSDLDEKDGVFYGKVVCHGNTYFTKTTVTSDCIETIAVTNISDFDRVDNLSNDENYIKINGIPNYQNSKNEVLQPMSKSHHGRFEKMVYLNA